MGKGDIVAERIHDFKDVDHTDIVSRLIEAGNILAVAKYLDDFNIPVGEKEEISHDALELLDDDAIPLGIIKVNEKKNEKRKKGFYLH